MVLWSRHAFPAEAAHHCLRTSVWQNPDWTRSAEAPAAAFMSATADWAKLAVGCVVAVCQASGIGHPIHIQSLYKEITAVVNIYQAIWCQQGPPVI